MLAQQLLQKTKCTTLPLKRSFVPSPNLARIVDRLASRKTNLNTIFLFIERCIHHFTTRKFFSQIPMAIFYTNVCFHK